MGAADPAIAQAARFERDRRAASYPAKIRALAAVGGDGPATEGAADAEALAIDYQCWAAIAEWLETGRFFSFAGGIHECDVACPEPCRAAPIIRWPELEAAAERALASADARCDRLFTADDVKAGEYEQACARRAQLWAIHRKVQLRRATVDAINAGLRNPRQQEIAA